MEALSPAPVGRLPRPPRVALVVLCTAVVLLLGLLGYLAVAGRPLGPTSGATSQASGHLTPTERRAVAPLAFALLAVFLLTVLAVALYLLNRVGRALSRPLAGRSVDAYVDAWSHYRLSNEEIERATAEEPEAEIEPPDDEDEPPAPPE